MKLDEIERIGLQILQAAVDELREVRFVVAVGGVGIEAAAGFGGDVNRLGALAAKLGDQAFAAAVAIDVGGVDEIDA